MFCLTFHPPFDKKIKNLLSMIESIIESIERYHNKIDEWLKTKFELLGNVKSYQQNLFPLYSSIDIRESSFKIAPVDVNLFPSGFNNFTSSDEIMSEIETSLQEYFVEHFNDDINGKAIALVVENFTRNEKYLANVDALKGIFKKCGASVQIYTIDLNNQIIPFGEDEDKEYKLENADMIILNNDLSIKIPPVLLEIQAKIFPNPIYGWCMRRKSIHFQHYNDLIIEMCNEINIGFDPWFLSSYIDSFQGVNFRDKEGLEELSLKVEKMLNKISNKYIENKINSIPHVFVKANNGTFGLGVTMVSSADDLININKKTRHKISTTKHGISNNDVVIQEGIPTAISFNDIKTSPAEHVVYSIGKNIIGILMRFHGEKNHEQSLNAQGMQMVLSSKKPNCVEKLIVNISKLAVISEGINLL